MARVVRIFRRPYGCWLQRCCRLLGCWLQRGCGLRPDFTSVLVAWLAFLCVFIEDKFDTASPLGTDPEKASVVFEADFGVGNSPRECVAAGIRVL